jgi:WD40 repeat protein
MQEEHQTMIWTLKVVSDEYLFSGDSTGLLKVWDPEHGTLVKSFSALQADVQAIAVNLKYGIVYATGVDSRILSV